jgi:hypothetical protein
MMMGRNDLCDLEALRSDGYRLQMPISGRSDHFPPAVYRELPTSTLEISIYREIYRYFYTATPTMPKRKRSSPSPSDDDKSSSSDHVLKRQKKLCTQRIATAQKPLIAALRLAAGFERQKYSRRRKTAKQKEDDKATTRLEAEYAVLKGLDIPKLGEQHLRRTIGKIKSLAAHEGIPEGLKEVEKGSHTPEYFNVTARLYKVPGVRKVIDAVVEDLKEILWIASGPQKRTKEEAVDEKEGPLKKTKKQREEPDGMVVDEDGGSDADTEDDFTQFDARIAAPSSADEDSDESLSEAQRPPSMIDSDREIEILSDESDAEMAEASDRAKPRNIHFPAGEDDSVSHTGASEASESDDEPLPPQKTKAKERVPAEKATKSTFLPSLSHAAYISGSDSEASDLDIDNAPKKNRRGQRARQKIWEKKYGEEAKHVSKGDRNKGWDPKRGAVSDDRNRRGGRGDRRGGAQTGYGPQISGGNMTELGSKKMKKRDDAGTLHPSWAAAKAAKEKKVNMQPQGKKITFD